MFQGDISVNATTNQFVHVLIPSEFATLARVTTPAIHFTLRDTAIHLRRNKLIEKRKSDAVNESLSNVVYKSHNVAVAVTRLQASATTVVTPATPTTPTHEDKFSLFISDKDLLALSGTKRRRTNSSYDMPASLPPVVNSSSSTGRLSSLKV